MTSVIRPAALVMHPNGLFFEDAGIALDRFAVRLWPDAMLHFERSANSLGCFAATEVLSANSRTPHPPVLVEGVLWSRRAILADGRCSAFCQSGANRKNRYGPYDLFKAIGMQSDGYGTQNRRITAVISQKIQSCSRDFGGGNASPEMVFVHGDHFKFGQVMQAFDGFLSKGHVAAFAHRYVSWIRSGQFYQQFAHQRPVQRPSFLSRHLWPSVWVWVWVRCVGAFNLAHRGHFFFISHEVRLVENFLFYG